LEKIEEGKKTVNGNLSQIDITYLFTVALTFPQGTTEILHVPASMLEHHPMATRLFLFFPSREPRLVDLTDAFPFFPLKAPSFYVSSKRPAGGSLGHSTLQTVLDTIMKDGTGESGIEWSS
jgi:hypothetical protein